MVPDTPKVQTIEQTAKFYKALKVLFWTLILIVCPILFLNDHPILGFFVLIIGVVGEIAVKIGVWWDHG